MKCLKIEAGKGYFCGSDGEFKEIDTISKDDIFRFLNIATGNEPTFEMDEFDEHLLQNEAHRIIYRSLSQKFSEVLEKKDRFLDESENMFKEAMEKYSITT